MLTAIVPIHGSAQPSRPFNGKPLYWHIFNTLEKASGVSRVYATSDDEDLANEIAKTFPKTQSIIRPNELHGDSHSPMALVQHVLDTVPGNHFLYTSIANPLLKAKTVEDAMITYYQWIPIYDTLISVNKLQSRLYSQWALPINHDPHIIIPVRQLEPVYEDNANMFMFSREVFEKHGIVGKNPYLYIMDRQESINVDDSEYYRIAEVLANEL